MVTEFDRRTVLRLAAILPGLGSVGRAAGEESQADDEPIAYPSQHEATFFPPNEPNPLIAVTSIDWALIGPVPFTNMGWENADPDLVIEELLRLDPDLIGEFGLQGFDGPPAEVGFWDRHKAVRRFAHRHSLPFQLGASYHLQPERWNEDYYRELPTDEKWRYPDGTVVEDPGAIAKRDFDGNRFVDAPDVEDATASITPSIFAGGTVDRLVACGQDTFEFGANHYFVDLFIEGILTGLDFSGWAQAAFRERLQSVEPERLRELGIEDPESFDIREYFRQNGVAPSDTQNPAPDPVFRAFNFFQHRRQKELAEQVFDGSRGDLPEALAEAGTSVHGEGHWLQWQAIHAANIYTADHLDIIHLNLNLSTVPPDRPHDVSIKLGRAVGRFEKPVAAGGRLNTPPGGRFGMDPERYYPTLLRFELGQAYAHGGRKRLPITSWDAVPDNRTIQSAMRPDGSIDESIHRTVDFIRAHQRFLTDFSEANRTAVIVSLPTLIYRAVNWGRHGNGHRPAVGEAATVLREAHVPYDVLVFDLPSLWEAPKQTERISDYDRVILPNVECVTDAQLSAIEAALEDETTVITTGEVPSRDEHYQPRDDLRQLLADHENGVQIEGGATFGENVTVEKGPGAPVLAERLGQADGHVELSTDADISLNVVEQTAPDRLVVHLLNFEYDPRSDSIPTREEFELRIRNPKLEAGTATYYSESGPTDLDVEGVEDGYRVTVPSLEVWGFVALGENSAALRSPRNENDAVDRLEAVRAALEDASLGDHDTLWVRTKLENAESALDFEAFGVAYDLAEEAEAIIEGSKAAQPGDREGADADSESTQTPGFGFPAAVMGLGSAIAYRLFSGDTE